SVDSGAGHLVPVNGKVSLAGLSAGSHSVTMYGAPPNCALSGAHTRAVEVLAGDTVLVAFEVACTSVGGASGQIAFVSDRDGNDEIYVMNADGSSPTRLTNNPATDFEPAWSPNAQKIAFTSQRDDARYYEIYVMEADGSHPTRLTNNPGENLAPAWSPDGKRIAFTSMGEVYVMNADGSSPTRLTSSPPDWDGAGDAAWSPDGAKIAFDGAIPYYSGAQWDIYVMNADGSGVVRLTQGAGNNYLPAWKP